MQKLLNPWVEKQTFQDVSPIKNGDFPIAILLLEGDTS